MLNANQAEAQARKMHDVRARELSKLDVVRRYWKGRQKFPTVIPTSAPRVVKVLSRISRVNICPIVVNTLAQAMFVDGFRDAKEKDNDAVWKIWQANKMDARQTGIHRAAFAYGRAYAIVLPGDPVPVIRGVSPRLLTAVYGDDPDWPVYALEKRSHSDWRLYDDTLVYTFSASDTSGTNLKLVEEPYEHGAGVTPVVRFLDEDDLDGDDEVRAEFGDSTWDPATTLGQISPLMALQDQIDITTFGLLVAQHYSAFRQRYILGWVPKDEQQLLHANASQIWTFEDEPGQGTDGIKVGEFGQTDLGGYIESREASLRHAATLSQTPVHELLGELVNLSAEALAAAEQGHERKVGERKTLLGESHEQMLRLAGSLAGETVSDSAEVIWRDTSARTFAATVDGLGKLATMLHVPEEALWELIPGVTQQDIKRWKDLAANGDSFQRLTELLDRQGKTTPLPAAA